MYRKDSTGWIKHVDFIILDLICLQVAFVLAYALSGYGANPYQLILYRNMAVFMEVADLVVLFAMGTLKNVLKRGYYKDFVVTAQHGVILGACLLLYLFMLQEGQQYSRLALVLNIIIYMLLTYLVRELWKHLLRKKMEDGENRSLLLVVTADVALVSRILESLPDIVDKGIQLILKLVQGITDAIPNVVEAMTKVITKILTTIIEHLPQIIESGFKILGGIITGIINCIPSLIKSLGQVIKQMIEAFTKVDWKEVGSNILEGIKNGILSAVGSVVDAAKNAASSIYNAVKDFFRIGSPSKLMRDDIGHWLPPGVAVGIEGNLSPVEKAMGELEDTVMTGLDMEALNISSNGRLFIESDESGATGKIDELMEKMESLAEYLITEVSNMQLVAMVDKDDVFSSVKQSAEEYKEQTRRPAFG